MSELPARAGGLIEQIRKFEWCPTWLGIYLVKLVCPSCHAWQEDGHESDCQLAAAIAAVEAEYTDLVERYAKVEKMLRRVVDWHYNRHPFQECLLSILRRAKELLEGIEEGDDAPQ